MSIAISGCGGSSSSSAGSTSDGGSTSGGGEEGGEAPKLALSNSYVESSWRPQMIHDFETEAEKLEGEGRISGFEVQNAENSVATQRQQIQTMVGQGAEVIVIDAASETGLNSVIEQAVAKGVTVVTFDNPASASGSLNLFQDENIITNKSAEEIARLAGEKGTVVEMNGVAGSPLSDDREKRADEVFAKYPEINVVKANAEWNAAVAKQKMATILAQNPEITGVWDQGDMASGVQSAFEEAGIEKLPPIVADGTYGFLNTWAKLKKQEGYETVGIVVPPAIVLDAVWAGLKLDEGGEAKENPLTLSHPLITNETLAEYVNAKEPAGNFIDVPVVDEEALYNEYMTGP
ncbi:MAG: substrate-binding domain-containing protein [Solirubrobacterales bacterium]